MGGRLEERGPVRVFYGWVIVGACFLFLLLFAGAGYYSFSIFIRPLEAEFGWSRASISLSMSIQFLVSGLFSPFVGRIVQSRGPRRLILLGATGAGASFILVSFAQALWQFYAAFALLGLFVSGVGTIPTSMLLSRWFVRRRGTAIGAAMVGISAGGLLFAPMIGVVTEHFSWRVAFLLLGGLVWALALPLALFVVRNSPVEMGVLPDGDRAPPSMERRGQGGGSQGPGLGPLTEWRLGAAMRGATFWWVGVAFFLAAGAQNGILQHQVPIVLEGGISVDLAAMALGLTAGFGGLGKLFFGRMTERLPVALAAALCFGIQACAVGLLLLWRTPPMVWGYILLFGFAMGGVVVLLPLSVGRYFGLASFGVILGALNLAQAMGGGLGAYLSGVLFDVSGTYRWALCLFGGIYLLAAGAVWMAGRSSRLPEEAPHQGR